MNFFSDFEKLAVCIVSNCLLNVYSLTCPHWNPCPASALTELTGDSFLAGLGVGYLNGLKPEECSEGLLRTINQQLQSNTHHACILSQRTLLSSHLVKPSSATPF